MTEATAPLVREIRADDRDRWAELFTAYLEFYESPVSEELLDRVWSWLLADGPELSALVAELDGVVVGIAHVRQQPDTFTGESSWHLEDLFTAPAARGHGVATALIAEIAAQQTPGSTVRWITAADNATAQSVYDKLATRTTWVTYEKNA